MTFVRYDVDGCEGLMYPAMKGRRRRFRARNVSGVYCTTAAFDVFVIISCLSYVVFS